MAPRLSQERIFRRDNQIECLIWLCNKQTAGFCKIIKATMDTQADHQAIQDSHNVSGMSNNQASGIITQGNVSAVVQAVFNSPIASGKR